MVYTSSFALVPTICLSSSCLGRCLCKVSTAPSVSATFLRLLGLLEVGNAGPSLAAESVRLTERVLASRSMSSLGGTHTIFVAAGDPRIAAVVAQIPYAGLPKERVGRTYRQAGRIMWLALKDRVRGWLGLSPLYVPAVGTVDEDAVLVDPHAREVTRFLSEDNSLWRNEVAPRIIFDILRLKPLDVAARVQAPLLVSIAERDAEAPPYLTRRLAELAPRGEGRSYPVTLYEMYRPDVREQVLADQLVFLKKHLLP
jgi:uncharacterized protein